MNKETKSISRSIRMTPTVYSVVDKFEGKGFNEKFENLVLFCLKEESNIKQKIATQKKTYDCQRDRRIKEIEELDNLINKKKSVINDLKQLEAIVNKITTDYK